MINHAALTHNLSKHLSNTQNTR